MKTVKVKTSELIGPALDWAVAKCEERAWPDNAAKFLGEQYYKPSTDWAHGGPIIEQERMQIDCFPLEKYASKENISSKGVGNPFHGCGPTPLIAAMRCFVSSKLGDEVEIPDQLGKT